MISKRFKPIFIIALLLLLSTNIKAQDVNITISAPKVVALNEAFQLVYTINKQPKAFRKPDLSDFIVNGPMTSNSSSVTIINGKVSQNTKISYRYVMQATKVGKFIIKPASFVVDGESYPTKSVSIEVLKGNSSNAQNNQSRQSSSGKTTNSKNLIVRIHLSKPTVYQGEHIVATSKIYTKANITGFNNAKPPAYTGFWSQKLEVPSTINLEKQNVKGEIYEVGTLTKHLLFPLRSGEIAIDPFELGVNYAYPTGKHYWNGRAEMKEAQTEIKSRVIKVKVKPLPTPKPDGFKGAVGDFKLSAVYDKTSLKTNDALTLKVKVSGIGNFNLLSEPEITFPPDFEVYDPKVAEQTKANSSGIKGYKSFEYVIIPRHNGTFTLPAIQLAYFNPKTKSYKTVTTKETVITVEKGEDESGSVTDYQVANKNSVKNLGNDIRYIKVSNIELSKKNSGIYNTLYYWLYFILITVAFVVLTFVMRKQLKVNQNQALVRNKKANKVSQKRLKQAKIYMDEQKNEAFFEEVLRTIQGYIGDKLIVDQADLSKDRISQILTDYKVSEEIVQRLIKVIDTCEFARYAPTTNAEIGDTFNEASDLINSIDQSLVKIKK